MLIKLHRVQPSLRLCNAGEDTTPYAFGRAAHVFLLEGRKAFYARYEIGGPINSRNGRCYLRGSQAFADWAAGRDCVTREEYEQIVVMDTAIKNHRAANLLLSAGEPEKNIRRDYMGLPSQSRLQNVH